MRCRGEAVLLVCGKLAEVPLTWKQTNSAQREPLGVMRTKVSSPGLPFLQPASGWGGGDFRRTPRVRVDTVGVLSAAAGEVILPSFGASDSLPVLMA